MLLLVRRPKWINPGKKDAARLPMALVEFDDGSYYMSINGAMFPLKAVDMKKRLFTKSGEALGQKYFISKFNR